MNDFSALILIYFVINYQLKGISVITWITLHEFLGGFMVNWFVQTVWIFARFSIQTIQTLNFIFVSALLHG